MSNDGHQRHRSSISAAVGERLRERRKDLGLSLREVAAAAAVSPGHLSEIETGRSHASLPVLLRLGRRLQYPLAELLPRIGGHRLRTAAIDRVEHGARGLSHDGLRLKIASLTLGTGMVHDLEIGPRDGAFVYTLTGEVVLTVAEIDYPLGERDAADIQNAPSARITATCEALVLLATCPRS